MKAIVATKYGSPDVLELKEFPKPLPGNDELLIKIYASTVTTGDCEIRRFDLPLLFWLPLRIILGIRKPRKGILGQELSGKIETVGGNVVRFKKGNQVFASSGLRLGGHAEYVCLPENYPIMEKPASLTWEEAATIPTGGLNAVHFIRKADIRYGEKVLINGAGGSIGTYGVQIARSVGAEVTCVDRTDKLEMLKSIGADHTIDYTRDDFTKNGKTYDVIIDVVGSSPFSESLRSLKPNGRYVLGNPRLPGMIRGLWTTMTTDKKVLSAFADYSEEDMEFLIELIEAGKVKPVMDRCYPLQEVAEAHRYVEGGNKKGNVAITVVHHPKPDTAAG